MGNSSTKAKNKYNKTAYRAINLQLKPDLMERLNEHCSKFEYTRNGFIGLAIEEKITKDSVKTESEKN